MKNLFVFLALHSTFLAYAQQEQIVQSMAFGDYLSPLVKIQKADAHYYYHLDGRHWIDKVQEHAGDMFVVVKDGHYGVLKEDGRLVVPFAYDGIKLETKYEGQWYDGLSYTYKIIVLEKDGKFGFADENGKIIVEPRFEESKAINKMVVAVKENNLWGWVSTVDGRVMHQPEYEYVRDFYGDDFVEIRNGDKAGLAKSNGEIIIPAKYGGYMRYLEVAERLLFECDKDGVSFLFDESGKELLSGHRDYMVLNGTSKISFKENKLLGIIDPFSKKVIVPAQFPTLNDCVRGLCIAAKSGKYGVIDTLGKTVLDFQYDEVTFISADGLPQSSYAPMISTPPVPVGSFNMSDEALQREKYKEEIRQHPFLILVKKQNEKGVYDWQGNAILPLGKYTYMKPHYYKGKTFFKVERDEKIGFTDEKGVEILPTQYLPTEQTYQFSNIDVQDQRDVYDRFVAFSTGKDQGSYSEKLGLFDLEMKKVIIQPAEQHIDILNKSLVQIRKTFADRNAEFYLYNISTGETRALPEGVTEIHLLNDRFLVFERNNRYELTDMQGNTIYTNPDWKTNGFAYQPNFPKYDGHHQANFHHGLLKIHTQEGHLFVDEMGQERRFEGYDYVDAFYEGFALVAREVKDKEGYKAYVYGLIDTSGKEVLPVVYENVSGVGSSGEMLELHKKGKQGVVSRTGKVIFEPVYDYVEYPTSSKNPNIIIKKKGKYGLADISGKTIVEPQYDEIRKDDDSKDQTWPLLVKEGSWYYFVGEGDHKYPIKAKERHY